MGRRNSGDDEVRDLDALDVKEVSIVDRPANRRRLLIVKRAEKHTNTEDAAGNGEHAGDAATENTDPATVAKNHEVLRTALAALSKDELAEALAKTLDTPTHDEEEVPMSDIQNKDAAGSGQEQTKTVADGGSASGGDGNNAANIDAGTPGGEGSGADTSGENAVEKAGRKLSRSRLTQLKGARDALGKASEALDALLREVDGDGAVSKDEGQPGGGNAAAATGDDALTKQVEALAGQVTTLTETVQKVARVKGVSKGLEGNEGAGTQEAGIWDGLLFGKNA